MNVLTPSETAAKIRSQRLTNKFVHETQVVLERKPDFPLGRRLARKLSQPEAA